MTEAAGELRFDGRVAIVTGAGRGIGRAHAAFLSARGARVVVADVGCEPDGSGTSSQPAAEVVAAIRAAGGEAVASGASVADEAGAASIVATALDTFGRVDVVINNAGIYAPAPFADVTTEQFRSMLEVHLLGTFLVTRAAWPHLVTAGYGRIVNTTSEAMLGGVPLVAAYGAAKAGIFGLTRNLAAEGAAHGIRANCLAPRAGTRMGDVQADATGLPREVMEQMKATMPPETIAPAAGFLAHESCRLNGEVLFVAPGRVARLAVVQTPGLVKDGFTAEDISANVDTLIDATGAYVTDLSRLP